MTRPAAWPVENGVLYSNTRLLPVSETQRLWPESNARPEGRSSPVGVVAVLLFVKVFWPITRLAAWPVENGLAYSRTRCPSTAQGLPPESNAREVGALSPVLLTSSFAVVKSGSPITRVAAWPVEKGILYWRTRPLRRSATHRLPAESKAIPLGLLRPVEFVAAYEFDVKSGCPITRLAASPVENGAVYSTTLSLEESTAQRLPLESNASAFGVFNPTEVVPEASDLKSGWPITRLAASWVASGAMYSRILFAPASATQRLPPESNATALGATRPAEVAPGLKVVKS